MEFVDGCSMGDLEQIKSRKINCKELARLLSKSFCHLIFKEGFVHSDPHQGNLYVKEIINKRGKKVPQLIILDHGIYKILDKSTRINYTKLWKGILMQEEDLIEEAAQSLGAGSDYKLFAAMITQRTFEDIMKDEKDVKERLRRFKNAEEKERLIFLAKEFHQQITIILQKINRDLLLLFKTHNFISSLDNKIGSPINTYELMVKN
jgi:aarF domain-containing kinase